MKATPRRSVRYAIALISAPSAVRPPHVGRDHGTLARSLAVAPAAVSVDGTKLVDSYTGRCLTIWECTDTENAVITADTCETACASANPEGQAWDVHTSGLLIKSPISKGVRCIDASMSHSQGEPPIVTHTCGLVRRCTLTVCSLLVDVSVGACHYGAEASRQSSHCPNVPVCCVRLPRYPGNEPRLDDGHEW